MKTQVVKRHRIRLAGLMIFLGVAGVLGCRQTPKPPYEPPPRTEPSLEKRSSASDTRSESKVFSWIRTGLAAELDSGLPSGPIRGILPGKSPSPATDPEVVQKVREALQTDKTFSPEAKAVQVSAEKGIVTLKGNVPTEREKVAVALKARQAAGNTYNVDNQVIVKTP